MKLLNLSGEWRLSDGEYRLKATVPGDITNDLFVGGMIDDPYYGENYKNCIKITQRDWVYEREFSLDALPKEDERAYLYFKGVDTYADVYVNGQKIGSIDSMFMEYKFPVEQVLKIGTNQISVSMHNVYDKLGKEEQTKYGSIFSANRIFIRKAQCHFGWDWAPKFSGYGIYRDVSLVIEKKYAIEEVGVFADINGDVTYRVGFAAPFTGDLRVSVYYGGELVAEEVTKVNESKKKLVNLHINNPKLWWPNGYGDQPLYDYVIQQEREKVEHAYKGRFGFRQVRLEKRAIDKDNLTWGFVVNGKKIFCRGSNWVPAECMTGRLKDEKYYRLVEAAKEANMNMLRVWGGGIYEKDCFYDYCDQMGIMVWQDFMIACSEVPEDDMSFVQKITAEATFQVKRLRDHPCMSYWCGANEIRGAFDGKEELYTVLTTHYLFRGITSELCPDIPYERTTPYAFAFMQNDPCEGDCHNNLSEPCLFGASFKGFDDFEYEDKNEWAVMKRRIKNYENYLEETKSNFSSECAVLGMCNYESLIKFTPEEERTLDSKFLENRFLGNPYTFVMPTFFERQKKFAEGMYGKVSDLKDLVKKCNKAQLDIMRSEIVYSRINGRSTGFLNWMYNDIWPTGTWSVIDYYLSKKPAYYEMKRCFQPLMCEIIRIGQSYFLCLANDFDSPAPFTATVGTKSYDGKTLVSQTLQATVEGNGTHIERLTFPTDGDYIFAEGQFKDTPVSTSYELGRYREQDITPHYEVEIKKTDSHTFEAVIQAKTFVRCFRIIAKNAYIEDNYFDLTAGERKRVKIVSHEKNAEISDIQYDTFADIWND